MAQRTCSFLARWPQRELEIRRKCSQDAIFRSILADYEEARAALDHWRGAEAADRRVEEYEELMEELEAELLARLDGST